MKFTFSADLKLKLWSGRPSSNLRSFHQIEKMRGFSLDTSTRAKTERRLKKTKNDFTYLRLCLFLSISAQENPHTTWEVHTERFEKAHVAFLMTLQVYLFIVH